MESMKEGEKGKQGRRKEKEYFGITKSEINVKTRIDKLIKA